MLQNALKLFQSSGLWALVVKELRQTLRNKHLLFLLLFPFTVQLIILGAALDPQLHHLKLAIVDLSRTPVSREFISSLTGCGVFNRADCPTAEELVRSITAGRFAAGVIIPAEFSSDIGAGRTASVQIILDGVDAYSANIAAGYLRLSLGQFQPNSLKVPALRLIHPQVVMLYNPALRASWYFIPGVLGAILTLTGTLVSSAALLREREQGTLEQILMTPLSGWEILLAKVIPIFTLLMADVLIAVGLAQLIFGLPCRGSMILFLAASSCYVCVCIGFGMLLGTLCRNQRQAQLLSFFINIPLIQLSGSVVPFESMPQVLQQLANFDPLRYFTLMARSILLKGDGLAVLWPDLLLLLMAAALLLTLTISRVRKQLN
jgi:ABC-2 type transport system permease protein